MSDPDIERIVQQIRMECNAAHKSRGETYPAVWIARRAAELAVAKEREKTAAMLKLLIDAPHQEHFFTRLNDEEMKGIDAIKEWLAAYNRAIRAGKEVGSE